MHKISKNISALLVTLLALAAVSGLIPVSASTGNILINTKMAPSVVISVKIGGDVNLYFAGVTWSGGTINLYLSTNGYASLDLATDIPYGPTFSVAKLKTGAIDTTSYPGYSIGLNWINGTIPTSLNVPGGNYYIKAFDGSTAAVAVTDNYITILGALMVAPTSGPGQAAIELKGYTFTPNDYVNLTYSTDGGATWTTIENFVATDADGQFVYAMIAPDLAKALPTTGTIQTSTIIFKAKSSVCEDTANFSEYWRGLIQVDGQMATAGTLYGNNTDFTASVQIPVLVDLIIAGQYFHPGVVTILWDNLISLGTTTANATKSRDA